jgi:crotonobetainyl-CoA:carnitine CoA-transferase CaiB-like acyl-CoA transferase
VLRVDSPRLPEIPAQALDMLPGKRSALLDFAEPSDRAALERLLVEADVVVQGYRPGRSPALASTTELGSDLPSFNRLTKANQAS